MILEIKYRPTFFSRSICLKYSSRPRAKRMNPSEEYQAAPLPPESLIYFSPLSHPNMLHFAGLVARSDGKNVLANQLHVFLRTLNIVFIKNFYGYYPRNKIFNTIIIDAIQLSNVMLICFRKCSSEFHETVPHQLHLTR